MTTKKRSRRGHGEGTRYQRADGYWIGQITIGRDAQGRQQRKTISAKTEKELIAKMKDYQYQQLKGTLPKTNKVTLAAWIDTWLSTYKEQTLRPTTYLNYRSLFQRNIEKDYIGKQQIQKLTTHHIQTFMKAKSALLAPQTVNHIHFIIKAALEQAKRNNIVSRNVAADCVRLRETKREIRPLSLGEVKALLTAAKAHSLYPALVLEIHTGLRRGELLGLRWKNVDFALGTITIIENLVQLRRGYAIHKPKTKSSIRTLYLPQKALECLKALKASQASAHDNGFVFCTPQGTPLDPRYFQGQFEALFKAAGLPKGTRFHDLRHTFITHLINQGVDIKTAQSFTGHADTSTLLDTYSHFITESQKQAAAKMNEVFIGL